MDEGGALCDGVDIVADAGQYNHLHHTIQHVRERGYLGNLREGIPKISISAISSSTTGLCCRLWPICKS